MDVQVHEPEAEQEQVVKVDEDVDELGASLATMSFGIIIWSTVIFAGAQVLAGFGVALGVLGAAFVLEKYISAFASAFRSVC